MTIAGHQPNFMPNLAFFYKMAHADLFVITTNIRLEKREGWQQRNKIRTQQKELWITTPIYGSQSQQIKDVQIDNQRDWRKRQARTLQLTYSKGKGNAYLPQLLSLYEKNWTRLVDFNVAIIHMLASILDIKTPLSIDEETTGVKHEIYIRICQKYKGDTFLSGLGSKNYLTPERLQDLEKHNITNTFVKKDLSAYPYSTVHYLLSEGKDWVKHALQ